MVTIMVTFKGTASKKDGSAHVKWGSGAGSEVILAASLLGLQRKCNAQVQRHDSSDEDAGVTKQKIKERTEEVRQGDGGKVERRPRRG